ncbi:MAG: hypothetical protein JWO83_2975 [Caulobacteraceae bacterium]|nr:hypothetical protein [Caulobacteraceae bacterium]
MFLVCAEPAFAESISFGLFHRWEPESAWMYLTAYVDESGTHGSDSPCIVLGGFLASAVKWRDFEIRWRKLKLKYGFQHFHSKEFRAGRGDFRGWSKTQTDAFLAYTDRLLARRMMFGFSFVLTLDEYNNLYLRTPKPKKEQLDSAYGLCFRFLLGWMARNLRRFIDDPKAILHIVLESGHKNAGDINRIFAGFTNIDETDWESTIKSVTFVVKGASPGIEVADIMAYWMFSHTRAPHPDLVEAFETQETAKFDLKQAKAESSLGCPIFRLDVSAKAIQDLRASIDEREQKRLHHGRRPSDRTQNDRFPP